MSKVKQIFNEYRVDLDDRKDAAALVRHSKEYYESARAMYELMTQVQDLDRENETAYNRLMDVFESLEHQPPELRDRIKKIGQYSMGDINKLTNVLRSNLKAATSVFRNAQATEKFINRPSGR